MLYLQVLIEKKLFIDSKLTMFKSFCLLLFSIFCFSQNEFQIIQSKTLENKTINNEKFEILSGDIIAKHKQHILYCDTMLISQKNDFVTAWGNNKVLIKDTSDLTIESNRIFFFKNDSIINFKNDVLCIKGEQRIYTNNLMLFSMMLIMTHNLSMTI